MWGAAFNFSVIRLLKRWSFLAPPFVLPFNYINQESATQILKSLTISLVSWNKGSSQSLVSIIKNHLITKEAFLINIFLNWLFKFNYVGWLVFISLRLWILQYSLLPLNLQNKLKFHHHCTRSRFKRHTRIRFSWALITRSACPTSC